MGTKFQYDESGSTFYYFVVTFMALVIFPSTYYYWSYNSSSSDYKKKKANCRCPPCLLKEELDKRDEPSKKLRQKIIKIVLVISWIILAFSAYKVSLIEPDIVTFDPFEILGIPPGSNNKVVKKAYHQLSLIYHPDKETGDEAKFMKISKAYAALTDEAAKKNWEEYGNPDGPGAMSFGIALPSCIVEKENSLLVLGAYVIVLLIGLPIGVKMWWNNSSKYGGGFKVLLDTTQLYYYYIHKTPSMIVRRVLMIVAGSFEFDKAHNSEIQERPTDNEELPQLIKQLPPTAVVSNNREAPLCNPYSIKARSLLYSHMLRLPLNPETLELDKQLILKKMPYLIQEFVQCAAQLIVLALNRQIQRSPTLETIENAMKLSPLVVQGLWLTKNSFLQLPHVTEDMLRHFFGKKRVLRNMQSLATMEEEERRSMMRFLNDEQYFDFKQFLSNLPLLDIACHPQVLDDEDERITAGALVTLIVNLNRRNMSVLYDANATPSNAVASQFSDGVEQEEHPEGATSAPVPAQPEKENTKPSPVPQKSTQKVWEKNKRYKGKGGKGKKRNVGSKQQKPSVHAGQPIVESESEKEEKDWSEVDSDDEEDNVPQGSGDDSSEFDEYDDDKPFETDKNGKKKKKEILKEISTISHPVHCPYFPENKQEHWWIYVSDRQKPVNLITVPYFMTNLVDDEEIELKFSAPLKPGTYQYMLNVRSDSYIDMDYFQNFKLDVREAPKIVENHPQWEISDEEEIQEEPEDSAVSDSDLCPSDSDSDVDGDK